MSLPNIAEELAPTPWSFDISPGWANVYAKDSTPICQIKGKHAEFFAQTIIDAVNRTQKCPVCAGAGGEHHWAEKKWRKCDRCDGTGKIANP